jgi:molybdopterin molybdotransferase
VGALLTPQEAIQLVLERVRLLPTEPVPVAEALGRVLAADVTSLEDVPAFDNSAMDGFAVRAQDTSSASPASPVRLTVVAESRAGRPSAIPIARGQAAGISTGAMLPEGADAVVRKEDCTESGKGVDVTVEVAPGKEVRGAGEDIRAGEIVIERGAALGPAELGVLASVGIAEAACSRRPRVSVLATGDELVEPGERLERGQIRNTNAYSVPALARLAGAEVTPIATVGDDRRATVKALRSGLAADALVVCGGVSVGPHDHVKDALAELGAEEVFWGVALRPGHPTWFGEWRSVAGRKQPADACLVFGLPGNPVSAMVTFHLFVRPALAAMCGASTVRRTATAAMDVDYRKTPGRAHVVRCRLEARDDGWHVRPTKRQGSHVLTSMLGAEALALIEVDRGDVHAGERVEIELI